MTRQQQKRQRRDARQDSPGDRKHERTARQGQIEQPSRTRCVTAWHRRAKRGLSGHVLPRCGCARLCPWLQQFHGLLVHLPEECPGVVCQRRERVPPEHTGFMRSLMRVVAWPGCGAHGRGDAVGHFARVKPARLEFEATHRRGEADLSAHGFMVLDGRLHEIAAECLSAGAEEAGVVDLDDAAGLVVVNPASGL